MGTNQSTKERLLGYTEKPINILLVEDHPLMKEKLPVILSRLFPQAKITVLKNFEEEDFDEVLKVGNFQIVFLDVELTNWKEHPLYGQSGINLIEPIKKINPEVIVVSISTYDTNNEFAQTKGADYSIQKGSIGDLLD